MSDRLDKSRFLMKVVPTLILISLLAWCTTSKRTQQNGLPVFAELREVFLTNGMIDSVGAPDLAVVAKKIGEPGMNRLLYDAAPSVSLAGLKWLVANGAVPSNVGAIGDLPLLLRAAKTPHYDRLQYLISQGCNPLERDRNGSTLLHLAAQGGMDERVMGLLTMKGLKTSDANQAGLQPIHMASVKSIPVLVAAGADINAVDGEGRTALHQAAANNRNDVVTELIRNGASVQSRDNRGRTPLHLAARARNADEVIETLLAAGALKAVRDNDGLTARDLAEDARDANNRRVSTMDKL